jgi:hypothetical protein
MLDGLLPLDLSFDFDERRAEKKWAEHSMCHVRSWLQQQSLRDP